MPKGGGGGRPTRQTQDTTRAKPRGTAIGRAVRSLPVVGDVVKAMDKASGDTTYTGPQKSNKIKGYGVK